MTGDGSEAAFAAVRAAVPDDMDRDGVVALVGDVRRLRAVLDSVERRAVRRLRELEARGESEPAESVLVNHGGRSGRDARASRERDELCDESPEVESALEVGAIGGEYVDAIAAAARDLPDAVRDEFLGHHDDLVARAGTVSLDAFRRECRDLAKHLLASSRTGADVDELAAQVEASKLQRWTDRHTGMHHTHLELDPVRDARLHALWQANIKRLRCAPGGRDRTWEQLQLDAFLHTLAGTRPEPAVGEGRQRDPSHGVVGQGSDGVDVSTRTAVPEITVVIDYRYLAGLADHGVCETEGGEPLQVSTVRRLCCEAQVVPAVLGGDGEVLDLGRARRTATRAQRRALRAVHRTCAHPDCQVGYDWCRLHHIRWWWEHRGATDIDNLLPLCDTHHHLVHERGWGLTMTSDRVATWTRPDGSHHHTGSTIDRRVECS